MSDETIPVRIWDLPTRTFHWVLALCVVGSLASAKIGGNAMVWHLRSGYAVFALLLFRLLWGFFGGRWSRFSNFAYAPAASIRYLRRRSRPEERHEVGHHPLGALWVFGLLAVLAVQVGTGLFADDEIATTGPLIRFVSGRTSSLLTHWHTTFGQGLIFALVALHLAALAYYLFVRKNNLLRPMLSGNKRLTADVPASVDTAASRLVALALFGVCVVVVVWLVGLGG
ncbi:MAG: cytochrome b/b6 domain-containing protein [Caldimonas sp.]